MRFTVNPENNALTIIEEFPDGQEIGSLFQFSEF